MMEKQLAVVPVTYEAAKAFFIELCPYKIVKVEKDETYRVAIFHIDIPGIEGPTTLYQFPRQEEGKPEAYFVPLWLKKLIEGKHAIPFQREESKRESRD